MRSRAIYLGTDGSAMIQLGQLMDEVMRAERLVVLEVDGERYVILRNRDLTLLGSQVEARSAGAVDRSQTA